MFGYMIRSLFYVFQLASEKLYEYWRQNNPDIRKVLIPKTSSSDKIFSENISISILLWL